MKDPGKYDKVKIAVFSIATSVGAISVLLKAYAYIGLMSFLLILDYSLMRLIASQSLSLTLAVSTLPAVFFQWHYNRKGDAL